MDELKKKLHIKSQYNIAVMQPYLFPYLGYYQLAYRTEAFIFLDDVGFIKQSFINRNNIRINGKAFRFTLPVENQSSYRSINKHNFSNNYKKILETIELSYKKTPNFSKVMPFIADTITQADRNVAKLAARSIEGVFSYLGLNRHFVFSSEIPKNNELQSQDRIIEICKILDAQRYTNAIGGINLYNRQEFRLAGIELEFIRMGNVTYQAPSYPFIPNLSIIDALMICPVDEIVSLLNEYEIL